MQRPHRGQVGCISGRLVGIKGNMDSGAWVMKVAGESSSFILKDSHYIITLINHTFSGSHSQCFFSLTWNVGPINLHRLHNCKDEVQLLFSYIPSVSYPAVSLSLRFFFTGGADKTQFWLFFLSEKCRVAVKYKTS